MRSRTAGRVSIRSRLDHLAARMRSSASSPRSAGSCAAKSNSRRAGWFRRREVLPWLILLEDSCQPKRKPEIGLPSAWPWKASCPARPRRRLRRPSAGADDPPAAARCGRPARAPIGSARRRAIAPIDHRLAQARHRRHRRQDLPAAACHEAAHIVIALAAAEDQHALCRAAASAPARSRGGSRVVAALERQLHHRDVRFREHDLHRHEHAMVPAARSFSPLLMPAPAGSVRSRAATSGAEPGAGHVRR